MAKTISIGIQDFEKIRTQDVFYIDKTSFIKEWWENKDDVTLITRPRRFGKTLTMSMLECFFSNRFAGRGDLFEDLEIWEDDKYRHIQGTLPVIFLTFAGVKHNTYEKMRCSINRLIKKTFDSYSWLKEEPWFSDSDRSFFSMVDINMDDPIASDSLNTLCGWLYRYYGKKCLILLDEYDTPLQEAYINGFWDEVVEYIRSIFNNTFKTNPYLEKAIMTGITRISKESIFSDLNNINVVTTTTNQYQTAFGFTEKEVFETMDNLGIQNSEKELVKLWYDGFVFGGVKDIYNPWSIIMYLKRGEMDTYWANTSANGLVSKILQQADSKLKKDFEILLSGNYIETVIDEQIVFSNLSKSRNAVWSLLLAGGYLKVESVLRGGLEEPLQYRLRLTNFEVSIMFRNMILNWFDEDESFNEFIIAMFKGDVSGMNYYMNKVALNTFSYFDVGNGPSEKSEPERLFHGFVLGLMVDKAKDYHLLSNRESGFARYDVVMEPEEKNRPAVIMEFKVQDEKYNKEDSLEETAQNALLQIEGLKYETALLSNGIKKENILKYGFAFRGKECLIVKG